MALTVVEERLPVPTLPVAQFMASTAAYLTKP
jgi:hypothetical protein